jgi:ankyrin repeat protein
MVEHLVEWEEGADLYTRCCSVRYSPLIAAVELDSMELVKCLLAHGIPVDSQGGYFGNALQLSAYKQTHDIFYFLLEKGADIHAECGQKGVLYKRLPLVLIPQ